MKPSFGKLRHFLGNASTKRPTP